MLVGMELCLLNIYAPNTDDDGYLETLVYGTRRKQNQELQDGEDLLTCLKRQEVGRSTGEVALAEAHRQVANVCNRLDYHVRQDYRKKETDQED
ncbi:hypothetical protein NDU88_007303 [Pleurodeles waltl]|uniref:Uncharacterized protein n=1 Tax=Pleurodeles waltl TaxID=8319 RepID=A0AAV7WD36_PLEWA|nr:hypothetical protein NDU88_007303 [Pleurodeles waltl]